MVKPESLVLASQRLVLCELTRKDAANCRQPTSTFITTHLMKKMKHIIARVSVPGKSSLKEPPCLLHLPSARTQARQWSGIFEQDHLQQFSARARRVRPQSQSQILHCVSTTAVAAVKTDFRASTAEATNASKAAARNEATPSVKNNLAGQTEGLANPNPQSLEETTTTWTNSIPNQRSGSCGFSLTSPETKALCFFRVSGQKLVGA